jgi:hypothetical protein
MDNWKYILGDATYTSSMFCNFPYRGVQHPPLLPPSHSYGYGSPAAPTKLKFFTWLLLMDRLNVRNILKRKKTD